LFLGFISFFAMSSSPYCWESFLSEALMNLRYLKQKIIEAFMVS
jgi:hypothetical protein